MHSFGADNLLILQKYFSITRMERGLYGFILLLVLISLSLVGLSQTQPADSTQILTSNNVANPDSIIDTDDFGFDEEVVYFGKDSTVMDLEAEKVYLYGLESYVKYGDLEVKAARIEFSFKEYVAYEGNS
jgi:hypothetical protein